MEITNTPHKAPSCMTGLILLFSEGHKGSVEIRFNAITLYIISAAGVMTPLPHLLWIAPRGLLAYLFGIDKNIDASSLTYYIK